MKHKNIICLSLTLTLLFTVAICMAQQPQPSNDSIRAKGMQAMQQKLLLSDQQVGAIIALTKTFEQDMRQVSNQLAPAARKQELDAKNEKYREGLKKVLTPTQWEAYTVIEKERRDALQKQQAERNKNAKAGGKN